MEVHHPHHPTHKIKWSEYIIEFVMLFAAVTLGFIAENIRERNTENKNTNKSLITLYKDIKADSINVSIAVSTRELIIKYDSIIMRYYNSKKLTNQISELHLFDWMLSLRSSYPRLNHMALDELNSNGKLNFIENDELKEYIQKYYQASMVMDERRTREHDLLDKHHDRFRIKYFNFNKPDIKEMVMEIDSISIRNGEIIYNNSSINLKLINDLEFEMKEYLNTVGFLVYIIRNDNIITIKPFQKSIESILAKLRSYFKENNIKYD
jgi:hypothetical protein